jgi:molecular chaperone GrpE
MPLGTSGEPAGADAPAEAVEIGAPDGAPIEPVDDDAVGRLAAERDEYLDALQRLKAEFDNYRKRVERDRDAQQRAGVRELVAELLPVIDNLERAVEALGGAGAPIVAGVEMVRGQLTGLLAGRGVEEIAAHASVFDPEVHEAVAQHPTDEHAEGTVVHVAEKGYRLGETVIRPAKVVVAARPPEQEE